MQIIEAIESDYKFITGRDRHINEQLVESKIKNGEIYILVEENIRIGWMRFGYFWDNLPFMNMLWLDEEYRGQGFGKKVVEHWEEKMKNKGFNQVMTSTQANEGAQHFYRKLGYKDVGCLLLENEPLEILMAKKL
ncbi:GNAT family N-acetyltransferase [Paenibacillus septentrionalis]|uniref:GNAT family N-acetyltransferase n=1 Tax=Paenibacillus septentrionalis TaxID=429342 RepID=A0ABW1V0N2_9BACL